MAGGEGGTNTRARSPERRESGLGAFPCASWGGGDLTRRGRAVAAIARGRGIVWGERAPHCLWEAPHCQREAPLVVTGARAAPPGLVLRAVELALLVTAQVIRGSKKTGNTTITTSS